MWIILSFKMATCLKPISVHYSIRDFLSWEVRAGGLSEHFQHDKTIEEVEKQFYWWSLKRDISKIIGQFR